MKHKSFAVFILTHGRAANVKTIKSLRKAGYTGKVLLVIDDEDEQEEHYKRIYGKQNVVVFDKSKVKADTMDNFNKRSIVLYARNKVFDIAEELGIKYFLVLDDDYTEFNFRYIENGKLKSLTVKQANKLFDVMLDFLDVSKALTVCMSQAGDFIGGKDGGYIHKGLSRKAMNSFFCRTDRPFKFYGTINEDVNMYVLNGMQGNKVFSVTSVSVNQMETQKQKKGLTDIYLDLGTYVKSFYSVMMEPSCVKVSMMGGSKKGMRLHHMVNWNHCAPKIISEKYKKE